MAQPFHIAIIGGGIAGLCLAHGLLNHPHISFDIYEKSDIFQERRTGIQFTGTARKALRAISPYLGQLPEQISGIESTMWTVVMGEGQFKGQTVYNHEYQPSERRIGFNRAAFLPGLLKYIPPERLHTGKRLRRIEVNEAAKEVEKYATIYFEDGTSAQADVVIGADGLRSVTRHHVLDGLLPHDDILARPLNLWDARLMIPIEIAQEHLGSLLPSAGHSRATMITGNDGVIYFTLNEGGKYAGCVIAGRRPQSTKSPWRFTLTQELLDEAFGEDWGDLGRSVKRFYLDQPKPEAFFEWDVNMFPTFCKGRVCLIADAAHAAAPWLAAGASIGMEDTAIMGKLLGKVESISEIETAFKVFTNARIGRARTLLENSRRSAFNMVEGARMTPDELKQADSHLQDFLSMDFDAHVTSILNAFEKEVAVERAGTKSELKSNL